MTKSRKPPLYPNAVGDRYGVSDTSKFTPEEKKTYDAFVRGRDEMRWRVIEEEAVATPPSYPDSPRYAYLSPRGR